MDNPIPMPILEHSKKRHRLPILIKSECNQHLNALQLENRIPEQVQPCNSVQHPPPPSLRVSTVTHAGVWTNTRSVCGLLIISAHGLYHETVCLQALRYSLKTRARQFTLRTVLSLFSSYLVVLAVDPFSATRFAYFPTA